MDTDKDIALIGLMAALEEAIEALRPFAHGDEYGAAFGDEYIITQHVFQEGGYPPIRVGALRQAKRVVDTFDEIHRQVSAERET